MPPIRVLPLSFPKIRQYYVNLLEMCIHTFVDFLQRIVFWKRYNPANHSMLEVSLIHDASALWWLFGKLRTVPSSTCTGLEAACNGIHLPDW